jgi:anthranilate synthase/aminodeoxychorismate synthase-like glutamine amidotransferase
VKQLSHASVDQPMQVLLLDNRDSFTWNLAQAFGELGADVVVEEALSVTPSSVCARAPRLVCIGPGPRGPSDLPLLVELVRALDGAVPLLGVCLGLQALVRARGGAVARARHPMHGKRDRITHDGVGVLAGLPSPLWVMRYHSLVATDVGAGLVVSARDADGQVMAVRDARARVEAVQFHPESIGTAGGMTMLSNALKLAGIPARVPAARAGAVPPPGDDGPSFSEARYGSAASVSDGAARLKTASAWEGR